MRCLHCLHEESAHYAFAPRRCLGDKKYREPCHCPGFEPEGVAVTSEPASGKMTDPGDVVERHPAYALVTLSRPTSTGTLLTGSDIAHHTFMEITVRRAHVERSLHRDWWYGEGPDLISFRLSASQWATFVSSQGDGGGTPCTLDYVDGHRVPDILEPPDRMARLRSEVAGKMAEPAERLRHLRHLRDLVDGAKMTKADKEAMRTALIHLSNSLAPNLTFVAQSVTEHLEATKDRVVAEAEAHVAKLIDTVGRGVLAGEGDALRRALAQATSGVPMPALPATDETDDLT